MADYNQEIAQVLYWIKSDTDFHDQFFQDPETVLAALAAAGYAVSEQARSVLLERVTPQNLDETYARVTRRVDPSQLLPQPPTLSINIDEDAELEEVDLRYFVRCLRQDEALRELFFTNPEEAYQATRFAGYDLSADSRRQLENLFTRENFADRTERIVRSTTAAPAWLPAVETPTQRIVNTGFAAAIAPAQPAATDTPLPAGTDHYFWFEVGDRVEGSIEAEDVALPDTLPPDVRLQIVLFTFPGSFEITTGLDIGEIEVPGTGPVRVTRRVAAPEGVSADMLARRLFFPLTTPAEPGRHRLRCHIYYRQTLVQARLVTVYVDAEPPANEVALRSVVDYTMSKSLDGRQLQGMGENRLSLMLNDSGNGTHGFRYFGENDFKQDLTLGEGELKTQIEMARDVLRYACWGDREKYKEGKNYKYARNRDLALLQKDLILMAQRGFRFFSDLLIPLAGDADSFAVWDWLLPPGQIQFASKRSARLVLPLAMMYDYPFDDGPDLDQYSLCQTFVSALQAGEPLLETACFKGNCPSYDDDHVVCPSGFWGFRHSIGLPVTNDSAPDVPTRLPVADRPQIAASVFTDFKLLSEHTQRLQRMGIGWEMADSRNETLTMLKKTEAQAVYFYCHGGLANGLPFLKVGTDEDERLVANNFLNKRIRWRKVRPLVFINGCHTTDLDPENVFDFVTTLMGTSHAAGVIGTEITIFEDLAVVFAEEFFQQFLVNKETVGDAIRMARIKMLQDWNPMGLVYIPYALPGMQLA